MAEQLRRLAAVAQALPKEFCDESAAEIAEAAEERLLVDSGGDASLSHQPAPLTVAVDIEGGGSEVTATITAEGGPQWAWLEEGTLPHQIGQNWMHPGTAGKETWSDATGRALRRLPSRAREAFSDMMGS